MLICLTVVKNLSFNIHTNFSELMAEDWKEYLSEEAKSILSRLFTKTQKYRGAYREADDVKIAQLWAALVEIQKEIDEVKEMLGKVEQPFKAIIEVGEAEKRKTIERLVCEIMRPTDEKTQTATKKLVDSLMKF